MSRDTRTSRRTSELLLSSTHHARCRLLPADYCQLGTAVCPPADTNGIGLESDMWFGDKALVLRRDMAGVIHYCQLGKMAVVRYINELRFFPTQTKPAKIGQFLRSRIWKPLTETQRKRISMPATLYIGCWLSIRGRQSREDLILSPSYKKASVMTATLYIRPDILAGCKTAKETAITDRRKFTEPAFVGLENRLRD